MNIFAVCGFAVCAACAAAALKHAEPRIAPLAAAAAAVILLGYTASQSAPVIEFARTVASESEAGEYFSLMLKALGIALVSRLAAGICRDIGEASLGAGVETAGKAAVILVSLPAVKKLLEFIKELV